MYHSTTGRLAVIAAALIAACAVPQTRADVIYQLSADTSSLAGGYGYLDFQFNQSASAAQAATAIVTNFSGGGGTLNSGDVTLTGDVTGGLPGTLTLQNTPGFNDAFLGFTFGGSVSLDVRLTGDAVNNPSASATEGSTFSFSLYQADGVTPISVSPDGSIVRLDIAPGTGVVTPTTSALFDGGPPAQANLLAPNTVPEPSSFQLTLLASAAGLAYSWRCRAVARRGRAMLLIPPG